MLAILHHSVKPSDESLLSCESTDIAQKEYHRGASSGLTKLRQPHFMMNLRGCLHPSLMLKSQHSRGLVTLIC